MKSLPKFPVALMSAMSGAVLLVFALRSHAVPENPAVDCGCCECYDLDGLTLYAGGTEVSSDSTEDCTDVSPDEEGQISLDLELPGPDDDCETCDETSLKVRVEDADGKSQQVETPGNLDTAEWKSPLTITVRCMKSGDSQGAPCKTFKICFGDCEDDCDTCPGGSDSTSGAGQPTGQNGSVQFSIPVGRSGFGRSNAQLFAHLGTTDNPGPSALKLTGWDGITKTTDGSGVIQSVTTESCHAVVAAAPTVTDPNAYTITLSYNPANPTTIANSVFRVVTVEELAGGIFQVTTTHGATISSVMRWWKTGSDWSFSQGTNSVITDGLRKVERFYLVNTDTVIKNRFKTYELDPDAPTPSYLLVSDEIKEFHRIGGAWKIVKLQKDPDGANLVSRWTYYLGGELTGPGSYAGTGDLKDYDRHDGYFERHTYAEFGEKGRQHMVTMPYAGTTMTRTTWWDPDTGEMAVTDALASGGVLAHSEVFWSRPTGYIKKTVRKYTGPSTYLDTSYYYHEAGSGKGNQLSRVAWPNGTGTIYDYALDGNLHRIFTEDTGKVSAGAVVEGTRKVTRKNRDGNVEETLVTAISAGAGNGTVLEHWLATAWDLLGRPTTIAWFPTLSTTWTTTRTYACCGLESETDKYGILTQNKYDAMGRRIRTNRLGVTEAVKYAGLTVSRYRYPETVTGGAFGSTLINEISRSVSNVAGTVSESWGPSPQTGALVKLSTETTTYRNPIGTVVDLGGVAIGQKVVKEVIQVADDGSIVPKQSSLYYRGGKLYRSWGDLEPATELSYGVVSALQFTTQSFIENVSTSGTGGTLRESRYTYVDRGGRLARRLQPGREDTYFHYNTLGQLERTVDAECVKTRNA